jgi:tRNA threonylcarbamoyladenosine biosynthesis protein TsaE
MRKPDARSSDVKHLASPEATFEWGRALGEALQAGAVVALCGDLGAGKTQASKGIVAGLGSKAEVSSPTFALVHEYGDGRLPAFHFDFYRLESEGEVVRMGWDDYLDEDGVVIVEWADRFPGLLPEGTRWFFLEHDADGGRRLREGGRP